MITWISITQFTSELRRIVIDVCFTRSLGFGYYLLCETWFHFLFYRLSVFWWVGDLYFLSWRWQSISYLVEFLICLGCEVSAPDARIVLWLWWKWSYSSFSFCLWCERILLGILVDILLLNNFNTGYLRISFFLWRFSTLLRCSINIWDSGYVLILRLYNNHIPQRISLLGCISLPPFKLARLPPLNGLVQPLLFYQFGIPKVLPRRFLWICVFQGIEETLFCVDVFGHVWSKVILVFEVHVLFQVDVLLLRLVWWFASFLLILHLHIELKDLLLARLIQQFADILNWRSRTHALVFVHRCALWRSLKPFSWYLLQTRDLWKWLVLGNLCWAWRFFIVALAAYCFPLGLGLQFLSRDDVLCDAGVIEEWVFHEVGTELLGLNVLVILRAWLDLIIALSIQQKFAILLVKFDIIPDEVLLDLHSLAARNCFLIFSKFEAITLWCHLRYSAYNLWQLNFLVEFSWFADSHFWSRCSFKFTFPWCFELVSILKSLCIRHLKYIGHLKPIIWCLKTVTGTKQTIILRIELDNWNCPRSLISCVVFHFLCFCKAIIQFAAIHNHIDICIYDASLPSMPLWKIGYAWCRRSLSVPLAFTYFLHWTWSSLFRIFTSWLFWFCLSQLLSRPFLVLFSNKFDSLFEFKLELSFLLFFDFGFDTPIHFHYFVVIVSVVYVVNLILYLLHISNCLIRRRRFMLGMELFGEYVIVRDVYFRQSSSCAHRTEILSNVGHLTVFDGFISIHLWLLDSVLSLHLVTQCKLHLLKLLLALRNLDDLSLFLNCSRNIESVEILVFLHGFFFFFVHQYWINKVRFTVL